MKKEWRKFIDSEISVSLFRTDPVAKEMQKAYQTIETKYKPLSKVNPHQMKTSSNGGWVFIVRAHPAILGKDTVSGSREWRSAITSILSGTQKLLDTSGQIDRDLETLGLVQTRQGSGVCISEGPSPLAEAQKMKILTTAQAA